MYYQNALRKTAGNRSVILNKKADSGAGSGNQLSFSDFSEKGFEL